jgi:hypothetical protein
VAWGGSRDGYPEVPIQGPREGVRTPPGQGPGGSWEGWAEGPGPSLLMYTCELD